MTVTQAAKILEVDRSRDAIDSGAARVALGHVPADVHEESYVEITNERLLRLVGIETKQQKLKIYKQA